MPPDVSNVLALSVPHELRRDFAAVIARAEPALGESEVAFLWNSCDEGCLDLLMTSGALEEPPLLAKLRSLHLRSTGALFIARSCAEEVRRELPRADALAVHLDALVAGRGLRSADYLILAFDDARRPHVGFVGQRAWLIPLLARLTRLADETIPVVVHGETGTGKELAARALHRLGVRARRRWLAINCAELPESILESELFGHARGAFTGASADRPGLFEAAGNGTVFLDEIGELPIAAQAKLLRVLEEHSVRRLGGNEARPLECRIVAATNRNLSEEVARGRFRADLFYRLRGAEVALPPLRDRPRDILPIARAFLARASLRFRRGSLTFTPAAELAIAAHSWPGNVRELRRAVETAALSAEGDALGVGELEIVREDIGPAESRPLVTVHALERAHILRALSLTAGNKRAAARLLGLSRQSLQRRIERLRIPEVRSDRREPDSLARRHD